MFLGILVFKTGLPVDAIPASVKMMLLFAAVIILLTLLFWWYVFSHAHSYTHVYSNNNIIITIVIFINYIFYLTINKGYMLNTRRMSDCNH